MGDILGIINNDVESYVSKYDLVWREYYSNGNGNYNYIKFASITSDGDLRLIGHIWNGGANVFNYMPNDIHIVCRKAFFRKSDGASSTYAGLVVRGWVCSKLLSNSRGIHGNICFYKNGNNVDLYIYQAGDNWGGLSVFITRAYALQSSSHVFTTPTGTLITTLNDLISEGAVMALSSGTSPKWL